MVDEGGCEELAIKFDTEMRNATVRFGEQLMPTKIYDLPCIIEVGLFSLIWWLLEMKSKWRIKKKWRIKMKNDRWCREENLKIIK